MAITLNGSTGIVSANIADGTIAASDLASGAITSAALPSGTVIQTQTVNWTSTLYDSTSSEKDLFSGQITIQAGSKIVAIASVGRYVNASGTWGKAYEMRLYVNSTLIQDTEHVGPNNTGEESFQHNLMGSSGILSAGTYTVKVTGQQIVSTNTHHFNRSPRSSWLIMQEVKG